MEITSPYEGVVKRLPHRPGDVVKVGSTLIEIEVADDATVSPQAPPAVTSSVEKERTQASPAVRLFARETNVRLSDVRPTGPGVRVTREDVQTFLNLQASGLSDVTGDGVKRIPIRGYRRTMFKTMTSSLSIPHFHFSDDVDMSAMLALKQRMGSEYLFGGLKPSVLPILIKTLSAALNEFPIVNGRLSDDQTEVLVQPRHNIGIAVATDDGLIVPVVKDVQNKNVVQIGHEMEELKKDALTNTCRPEDLSNATMTVSNVGSIGGSYATPLIAPPQLSIVALGRLRSVVTMENGVVKTKPMMPISWGADHRVLDGATIVEFSNRWKEFVERPDVLTLLLK